MFRENEEGIALIWVLILLVVVGTLAAALLTSARTHTNIAVHEERMSQAFHSAEAGVEYVKTNINKALGRLHSGEEYIFPEDDNGYIEFGEIKFRVEKAEEADNTLISEGIYDDYRQRIQFELDALFFEANVFNIGRHYELDEDHFDLSGAPSDYELLKQQTVIVDWHGRFDSFEEFYDEMIDNEIDDFDKKDAAYIENKSDIDDEMLIIEESVNFTGNNPNPIKDSIIVIDGHLDAHPQRHIENSVLIVKDYINFSGASASDWENPLILIYAEEDLDGDFYLELDGTGNFDLDFDEISNLPVNISKDGIYESEDVGIKKWMQL